MKLFIAIVVIFIGLIGAYHLLSLSVNSRVLSTANVTSPIAAPEFIIPTTFVMPAAYIPTKMSSLKDVVDAALAGTKGTYAIVIKNLKTGEAYSSKEHVFFDTGSLYKLWVMATVFKQIEKGQLQEDQVLSEDAAQLNKIFNIDPDAAEQTEGEVTFTVRDALNQMITISHNYAALLLTENIKLSSVATLLTENGLTESKVGVNGESPSATASDIALFLEKLYHRELTNILYTDEMLTLLKNQQLDNGIPKYLPEAQVVANKTGDIDSYKHDAGIVFTDKGDYLIVVMSTSDYPPDAQERIARVSKGVFDYFMNK